MNKKFSTLLGGFLLAGGLFSVLEAENLPIGSDIAADFKNGNEYYLVNTIDGVKYVYGFEEIAGSPNLVQQVVKKITDSDFGENDYKNYLWKVEEVKLTGVGESPVKYGYKLTNKATSKQLIFNNDGTVDVDYSDNDDLDDKAYFFIFDGNAQYKNVTTTSANIYDGFQYGSSSSYTHLAVYTSPARLERWNNVKSSAFSFYSYEDVEMGDELNQLYNSIGFNFGITGEDKVDNIFDKEGVRIKAIELTGDKTGESGFAFPKGTYFVTETPAGMDTKDPSYDELMNCTFIAASPSLNDINLAADRKTGKGFQLTTVSGKDLNNYVGTEDSRKSQGEDISVYNACFKVLRNSDGNYDLSLAKFRFNEKADSDEQTDAAKTVRFAVTPKTGDDHTEKYLTTILSDDPNYYFVYKETNTAKATDFLNESAKAVYTIQFAAGDAEGKYLYATAYDQDDSNSDIYAKGAAFVDTNMPEAQWIISDVKTADNTIKFTNRANKNISFTTKLYKESDGSYTMALDAATNYYDLNVNNDGDIIAASSTKNLHASVVELKQVTTDKFAGTWNVADGTEVTMLFARDVTPTSNKLYVTRTLDATTGNETNTLEVSNKLADAIQFKLVKSVDSVIITNPYAYKVGDVIKYQSKGDTIAYYTYEMQAYQDGVAKDLFLDWNSSKYELATTGDKFIIKDNVDGSVSVLTTNNYAHEDFIAVEDWKGTGNTSGKSFVEYYAKKAIKFGKLTEAVGANYVKTYLNIEAPETSLAATESYVTIKSDLGNYITMNEDRDGIMASTDPATIRVIATDTEKNIPSFYITTGWNEDGSRMFMFNPSDSVNYYVAEGSYDKKYQWDEEVNKVIFKNATLSGAKNDTLSTEIKGVKTLVADKADNNKKVQGGLDKFKYQIILAEDEDNLYWIRQNGEYLTSINGKLTFSNGTTTNAVKVYVEKTSAPTANETIAAGNVVVAGTNGAVVVKGAEGKNVIVSTILGKVVANEVVSSDNAQIATPAGIVVVSVDGESFKVVVK
ncbi:DUF6383 domain-containing protein [Parabacteroides sp. AD58]|uniref:DUF6383 domain-containing protein n=1 Tax=Parabacteroides absconsus TaxID=2951805 RepID=A0ABZ2IRD5_9BACT|nr:DUF6383 domain-containing protein [Parabacteroides sp. AD58]MCM6901462.1 DUF6383 domain-containing protein [Parabacteroides sp. AD58]